MDSTFKFNLEDEVKCRFTGFVGFVMARTEWNNGCIRYSLQAPVKKDGSVPALEVFDEQDLTLVKPVRKSASTGPRKGGPSRGDPVSAVGR